MMKGRNERTNKQTDKQTNEQTQQTNERNGKGTTQQHKTQRVWGMLKMKHKTETVIHSM